MENIFKVKQQIYFIGENLPMTVKAVSEKYVIVSRPLNKNADDDLLEFEVTRGAYFSKKEAYENLKDKPVYSILDFQNEIRGTDNLIFGLFDYADEKECQQAIKALEQSKIEISYRNRTELNVDWETTKFNN